MERKVGYVGHGVHQTDKPGRRGIHNFQQDTDVLICDKPLNWRPSQKGIHTNSTMTPRLIGKHCELDAEGACYLEHAMTNNNFSARAHDRILKVARTLADLADCNQIQGDHVLEAINYRTLDRAMWS